MDFQQTDISLRNIHILHYFVSFFYSFLRNINRFRNKRRSFIKPLLLFKKAIISKNINDNPIILRYTLKILRNDLLILLRSLHNYKHLALY